MTASAYANEYAYIEAQFDDIRLVFKLATQGCGLCAGDNYVTSYSIETRGQSGAYYMINAENGSARIFEGNEDKDSIVENCLGYRAVQLVRLFPQTWVGNIALRWDVWALDDTSTVYSSKQKHSIYELPV